jgi:4-amino-4-deoxy-L-arabinose transferase-like glycosyltransferase
MRSHRHLIIITGIAIILLFIKLGAVSVFQVAEARNSRVPVEMLQTGNYIVPYFNDSIRTDKPPLHYYAMLLAYKIGGIQEASARFFSSLCGLIVIVAIFFFTKRNAGKKVAWWCCLVLLASLHTIFQFRLATPDPYLVACHVLSLFCFWEGYKTQKKSFFLLMYVLWGLAILAKGPVGLLLPAGTVLLYLLFARQLTWKRFRSFRPFSGLLIVILIALPWFYLVHKQTNGEWTNGFLLEHNFNRFSKPFDAHKGSIYLPLVFIIAGLFPFSFFIVRPVASVWRQHKQNNWLFFNLLAAACVVIPYCLSATKLINYTTPAYPFTAIVIGVYISQFISSNTNERKLMPEWIVLCLAAIALPVAIFYWMSSSPELYFLRTLSGLLFIFTLAVLWGFHRYYNVQLYKAFLVISLGAIVQNILFFVVLYPALDGSGSVKQQKRLVAAGADVVAYRSFNNAFVFYRQKPIVVLPTAAAVSDYLQQFPHVLVLERAWRPHLLDTISQLCVVSFEKDLFSRQYSIIYQLKENQ